LDAVVSGSSTELFQRNKTLRPLCFLASLHEHVIEGNGALPLLIKGYYALHRVASAREPALQDPLIDLLDQFRWNPDLNLNRRHRVNSNVYRI